jgi:hypothetical protein
VIVTVCLGNGACPDADVSLAMRKTGHTLPVSLADGSVE